MPTALIVEDEPEANRLLSLLLQLRGYKTESAFTGHEALSAVDSRPPDVVFLDLMLPDVTGFDVCRAIKGRRSTNPIPVVMVTARLAAENRAQSYRVGANDFVPKPYTPDQIFEALKAADTWRRELEASPDRGTIVLERTTDGRPFAGVARLYSLMLARTAWEESDIRQVGLVLCELGEEAIDWGKRNGQSRIAELEYLISPDGLAIRIVDRSNWLSRADPAERERIDEIIAMGRFERSADDAEPGVVVLERRFSAAAAEPAR